MKNIAALLVVSAISCGPAFRVADQKEGSDQSPVTSEEMDAGADASQDAGPGHSSVPVKEKR